MSDWTASLQEFRTRELHIAFAGCPNRVFKKALELGAGAGFQSRLLTRYAASLVSTDLNEERLKRIPAPHVEYLTCDAERVDEYFERDTFDLVFASNLFEHLPDPQAALAGIKKILTPGGIVILIMPNALWKAFSLAGFYPNALRLLWRAARHGRLHVLWNRYVFRKKTVAPVTGNNLKSKQNTETSANILWPVPHGAYPGHLAEFKDYRKIQWLAEFRAAGFDTVKVRSGPVSSGYGFGLDAMRRLFESVGVTTEYIYVLTENVNDSPYAIYWQKAP